MSEREDIAAHIVTTLSAVSSPITFGKVTREPFELDELSQQQFPAVYIQTADETREDVSIKNSNITRTGTIDLLEPLYLYKTLLKIELDKVRVLVVVDLKDILKVMLRKELNEVQH